MACSCGRADHLDALLIDGPWDGQRFRVHDPPEPIINVPNPPARVSLDPESEQQLGTEVPVTRYDFGGIRDDGIRWYRAHGV